MKIQSHQLKIQGKMENVLASERQLVSQHQSASPYNKALTISMGKAHDAHLSSMIRLAGN